jgi:hypothetical protein
VRHAAGLALAVLLVGTAAAEEVSYPQFATEVDLGVYGVGTARASDAARRGVAGFVFGHVSAGLHLSPTLSIQGALAFEPIGEGDSTGGTPEGGATLFRRQAAFLESLRLEWKPDEELTLYGGRFVAPFGRGHEDFPGLLTSVRAHEAYLIKDALGVGGTARVLSDPAWGEHDLSAAVFAFDRSFLSSTLITRRACCDARYERYERSTAAQGGPGNSGRVDNVAVALDGDGIAALPGFSYHLALLSRGPGRDGTAREWGYAAGIRQVLRWSDTQSTLLFAEAVQFRNAEARPRTDVVSLVFDPLSSSFVAVTSEAIQRERRTFSTLGVQHRMGEWRGTLAWQRDQRRRSVDPVPAEDFVEVSVGRRLTEHVGLDLGYQQARYVREETGGLGTSHAVVLRLGLTGF